jgi:hypothetical protein
MILHHVPTINTANVIAVKISAIECRINTLLTSFKDKCSEYAAFLEDVFV